MRRTLLTDEDGPRLEVPLMRATTRTLSLLIVLLSPGCYDSSDVGILGYDHDAMKEAAATQSLFLTEEDVKMPGSIDGTNDVSNVDDHFEKRFDALPLARSMSSEPWSDTYWPENKGGISYRWQRHEAFGRTLAPDELAQMDPEDISKLSPAEKYDLYLGATDWPLTTRVHSETSPTEASWTGYCHGWAPASMQFPEPAPITVTNPEGVEVRFGSSDIKALLTYYTGQVLPTEHSLDVLPFGVYSRGVGSNCGHGRADLPQCHDVNPGSLHLMLGNLIGLRAEGFVMDVDPTYEKWNQPVFAYRSEVLSRRAPSVGAAETAVEEVLVVSDVQWGMEIEPRWEPTVSTEHNSTEGRRLIYTVELDSSGEVVGGQWVLRTDEGEFLTMAAAWHYLIAWDQDGDGQTDLTRDEASRIIFEWFPIPDFAWTQDRAPLPSEYTPVTTYWQLIGGSLNTRRSLYGYFGKLHELL